MAAQAHLYLSNPDFIVKSEGWEKAKGLTVQEPSIDKGSDWDTPAHTGTNYSAQMSFTREASGDGPLGSWEAWINEALDMKLAPWQSRVLGQFVETPREELLRRLNCWARGIYPGLPNNWKGLS